MGVLFLIIALIVNNEILSLALFTVWGGVNALRLLEIASERR